MRAATFSRASLSSQRAEDSQGYKSNAVTVTGPNDYQSLSTLTQCKRPSASYSAPLRDSSYMPLTTHEKLHIFKSDCSKPLRMQKGFFREWLSPFEDSRWARGKLIRNNKNELVGWFLLFMLIIVGFKFFSDRSFSAILTLASWFQCFSMFLLNLKASNQHSTSGISRKSVALVILCLICRLSSTLFFNGYLPVDRSGDWLYQGGDILSATLASTLLLYSFKTSSISVHAPQQNNDTCHVLIPMAIALTLAVCIHPSLNRNFIFDTAWTFALYLETYSMVPQLFMMGKSQGEVEAMTSHYVASMAASKIFCFIFWYFSYKELAINKTGFNVAGWSVMISYTIQVLLFVDFL